MVSATDDGTLRHVYAGTVPIYGCDSFELFTEAKAEGHPDPSADHWRNSPFSGALQRLSTWIWDDLGHILFVFFYNLFIGMVMVVMVWCFFDMVWRLKVGFAEGRVFWIRFVV